METAKLGGFEEKVTSLETKYRDIADGNPFAPVAQYARTEGWKPSTAI